MTQAEKGKEINIFKSLALSNVFSTKSEEQEVHLVWPNLCIFWLPFICLFRSCSWSLPNFFWMNINGYQNYRSSLLTGFRAEKIIYLGFLPSRGHWSRLSPVCLGMECFTPASISGSLSLSSASLSSSPWSDIESMWHHFKLECTGLIKTKIPN